MPSGASVAIVKLSQLGSEAVTSGGEKADNSTNYRYSYVHPFY